MRLWNLSGPEVEAADAEPWDGPFAATMRPFGVDSIRRLSFASMLLLTISAGGGFVLIATTPSAPRDPDLFVAFNVAALVFALTQGVLLLAMPLRFLRRTFPAIALLSFAATPPLVTTGFAAAGPQLGIVAVAYIQGPLLAFYMLRRRWAVTYSLVMLAGVAYVLSEVGDWTAPVGTWALIAANVIATGLLVGQIAASLDDRVQAQVAEIGRLGRLRRFLAPQVADAVLSGEGHDLTEPHRRRIAVLFCDLRGFTAFTNGAEPEEVIGVLDEYYRAVGELLHQHDATIGEYAGDGIMAYLGDPVPREDAAVAMVRLTGEIVTVMNPLTAEWQRRGHDLGFGIGLAYGYATLGVVGFGGRYDYTPIGGVVNLAARLCAKAAPGQVLLDHATYIESAEVAGSERVADVELKGYGVPQRVYALGVTQPTA